MKREENTALRLRHDRKIELSRSGGLPRTPAGFTVQALDGYGLRDILPARPTRAAFISGCCSSGRDFVPRFLQTVPRGSALALHSCFTSIRLHRGLSPPDRWACPAHRTLCAAARLAWQRQTVCRGHASGVPRATANGGLPLGTRRHSTDELSRLRYRELRKRGHSHGRALRTVR